MNQPTPPAQTLELIPQSTSEQLDGHAKRLHAYILGFRKAGAETFGYAFLAGRVFLQAKECVPHGNCLPGAGFQKWIAAHFPEITYRTATNWMRFAESVVSHVRVTTPKSPLLLDAKKLSAASRNAVLKLVPDVMDGKGMVEFMRDSRLLRDPQRPKHHPAKPVSKQEEAKAKAAQAKRLWDGIAADLDTATKVVSRVPDTADLKRYLDTTITASNALRAAIKRRGESPNPTTPTE